MAIIALNTLFILSFHRGTFPLYFQDKGRRLWSTFERVCTMHRTAGLQEVWQSAGSCLQAGKVSSWAASPAACAARPARLWARHLAGRDCSLSPPKCSSDAWWIFYLFMLNATITSCVYAVNFVGENKGIFVLSCRQHSTLGTGSVFIS